jgi:hypothetical protein
MVDGRDRQLGYLTGSVLLSIFIFFAIFARPSRLMLLVPPNPDATTSPVCWRITSHAQILLQTQGARPHAAVEQ